MKKIFYFRLEKELINRLLIDQYDDENESEGSEEKDRIDLNDSNALCKNKNQKLLAKIS
jgi:hypothetical protein